MPVVFIRQSSKIIVKIKVIKVCVNFLNNPLWKNVCKDLKVYTQLNLFYVNINPNTIFLICPAKFFTDEIQWISSPASLMHVKIHAEHNQKK